MNGDTTTSEAPPPPTTKTRKPRPEIQIYRPGALRQGSGSTKNLSTNDDRPPRPEKLTTSSGNNSRRRSNDTDSVTSRGGSGSTTPDAMAMNERGRNRFEGRGGAGGNSNYNSTQSLYDTRQHGGYMEYNGSSGGAHGNRSNHHRNGGGGRFQNPNPNYHRNQQNQQSQPFERNYQSSRGFSERASMRGDGAIARRPQTTSRRQRNDSINSTQSEMPANNTQLHIDTSFDSASQCGASSNFSMNSLGEAFSFEEMCQNLQNFASMDWSKEVENEFAMQKELEEEEERQQAAEEAEMARKTTQERRSPRKNRRNRRNYDESDRESSFGGSIAEEKEPEDDPEEELKSGERTPTSIRSGSSYNPRVMYQKSRAATNDENHHGRRQKENLSTKKEAPRRYRGEHDDRDDDTTEYSSLETSNTGRLAGRITIVPRNREQEQNRNHRKTSADESSQQQRQFYQKRSEKAQSEMVNRAEINRRRQEEIDKNEGLRIREIGEKMDKLSGAVKKRDLKSAERISEFSMELANIYSKLILEDVIYSFTAGLEQKLFRQAFYKSIECLRSGANSASPDARLIRAATQKLLLNGILFYETLISKYEQQFQLTLADVLTWQSGFPTDEQLCSTALDLPIGSQKFESATQKTAIKSLSRHLISLGDLHRYKSLIDGSENYEISKSYYQKSSQLWPSTGHPYNQLGIVVYYSMLYRSARRARLVPVDVLSKQRQKRVIDEFFYLSRALACSHPYEAARDRLKQRLDAMRTKISKYQPVLDKECGIVKEQGNALRKLQMIQQIWIHPTTESTEYGTGEKVVDDVLSHFMTHSKAKLHRRAVSYLCDTFGLLFTKIGMEHFENVSERAFGLLYAALAKEEIDFEADQLVKLAVMFIFVVQTNFEKASTSSESTSQLQISANTLCTYFHILREHMPRHRDLIFPAINVIATWIRNDATEEILKTLGHHLETLTSSILPNFQGFPSFSEDGIPELSENQVYPEAVLLASFFKIFDAVPTAATSSRVENLKLAVEKFRILAERTENSEEKTSKIERNSEEPKSREQMIEEERDKGKGTILIHPEYLIPDTNVFVGELQLVKEILEMAQTAKKFQILVPTIVLDELQSISKLSPTDSKSQSEQHDPDRISKAKTAVNWLKEQSKLKTPNLYTLTTTGKRLASLLMAAEDLSGTGKMTNDDMILNSALRWSESLPLPSQNSILQNVATTTSLTSSESAVFLRNCVLITGDRGLTIKAIGNNLPCRGIANFVKWMRC
ncbi:hypothetical protein B9Z55_008573 [Caenorhabditis nigoni]|uniref:PIN domain-containing protein n=3 Tax=Caenorhabditis nigoni TaxID=1611254 RepID=A0A2G5UN46_9PELO|nr:hypothetical protein B9Z55_008573 [Caenorhabditis nigoni]